MKTKYFTVISVILIALAAGCTSVPSITPDEVSNASAERELMDKLGIEFFSPSSFPTLYFNGDEVREGMLKLINRASEYIVINSFLILNDRYGNIILNALKEKHDQGVKVYVMSDSSSRFLGVESGFSYMKRNGIPYAEYNPIRLWKIIPPVKIPKMRYRDHRKYFVVDGKYVLLGGCNIMNASLEPREEKGHTDGMVLIESPDVAKQLLVSFVENWNRFSHYRINTGLFPVSSEIPRETSVVLFNQDTFDKEPVMEFMVNRLFASAEKEVWIIQPYTFITDEIISYIKDMSGRSVNVNIVLSETANHVKFHDASYYGIKDLIEAGAAVWIYSYKGSPLHLKAYVIDDRFFSIGSSNFNRRSFKLSAEANLLFADRKSFGILIRSLTEIKKHLRRVDLKEAEKYRSLNYKKWFLIMQNAG